MTHLSPQAGREVRDAILRAIHGTGSVSDAKALSAVYSRRSQQALVQAFASNSDILIKLYLAQALSSFRHPAGIQFIKEGLLRLNPEDRLKALVGIKLDLVGGAETEDDILLDPLQELLRGSRFGTREHYWVASILLIGFGQNELVSVFCTYVDSFVILDSAIKRELVSDLNLLDLPLLRKIVPPEGFEVLFAKCPPLARSHLPLIAGKLLYDGVDVWLKRFAEDSDETVASNANFVLKNR